MRSTEGDGSFTLSTYGPNDGAPAGEYKVIIFHSASPTNPKTAAGRAAAGEVPRSGDVGPDRHGETGQERVHLRVEEVTEEWVWLALLRTFMS